MALNVCAQAKRPVSFAQQLHAVRYLLEWAQARIAGLRLESITTQRGSSLLVVLVLHGQRFACSPPIGCTRG
jgi:hypothetical protein